jgi:hypothetical protein
MASVSRVGLDARVRPWERPSDILKASTLASANHRPQPSSPNGYLGGTDASVDVEETDVPNPSLQVRESEGKGLGLFTLDAIPAYTKVVEDNALISLAHGEDLPQLWAKYLALPLEDQESFNTLSLPVKYTEKELVLKDKLVSRGYSQHQAELMSKVSSQFQANAFKTTAADPSPNRWAYALFNTVARINHSCAPNCHAHYCPASGSQVVHALREIRAGEELSISYFDMTMPYAARQARAESWGFACKCPSCVEHEASPTNIYEIQLAKIHKALKAGVAHSQASTETDMKDAIKLASNPAHPWLVAALPRLYHSLALMMSPVHRHVGEVSQLDEGARAMLQEALAWECAITGPTSPMSQERRATLLRGEPSSESDTNILR